MTGLLTIYETITRAGKPFLKQLLAHRVRRGKEDPNRLNERMGIAGKTRPAGKLVWVHAASVGEAQSALILIEALGKNVHGVNVLVTTGTLTSATLMQRRLPSFAFHQYAPMDHPDWIRTFLGHWQPDLALWMESELWPNTLLALKKRGVPLILVNARLSEKSFSNWMLAKSMAHSVMGCFTAILAQTQLDADRFKTLGAANVTVTDNIKYSAAALPHDADALTALKLTVAERPLWVYASTHAGEEDLACRVHKSIKATLPDLLTVLVPRHPERRDDVAETCFENGLKFRLRSNHTALPSPDDDVYIADTLGELGLFYTLAPIAMIGRSFSNDGGGGHNPIEAAQLGCAVLTGPNNQFQRPLYDDMQADSAVVEVQNEAELTGILEDLLTKPEKLHAMQDRSATFTRRKTHVIDTVMEKLMPHLKGTENRHAA